MKKNKKMRYYVSTARLSRNIPWERTFRKKIPLMNRSVDSVV